MTEENKSEEPQATSNAETAKNYTPSADCIGERSERDRERIKAKREEAVERAIHDSEERRSIEDVVMSFELATPMGPKDAVEHASDEAKNVDIADNMENLVWRGSVVGSMKMHMAGDVLKKATERSSADWRQIINHDGKDLRPGAPRLGHGSGEKLTGEAAVLKMNAVLNKGTVFQVPLWESGFWVSIKSPSDADIINYERNVRSAKVNIGRLTYGLAFSNVTVVRKKYLLRMIYDHIYESNVSGLTYETFLDNLSVLDIPQLTWGLSVTMYPRGYPTSQPCTAKLGECTHTVEEMLNLARLSWTDRNAFSEDELRHMSNQYAKQSLEKVTEYRRSRTHSFVIDDLVRFDLKVPTAREYLESGERWINDIQTLVEETTAPASRSYNDVFTTLAKATSIQQYSHWVDRIVFLDPHTGEEDQYIEDRSTIERTCAELSSNEEYVTRVKTEVAELIAMATRSFIGMPTYTCPSCHGEQITAGNDYLIPFDAERMFFTLANQKVTALVSRTEP